MSTVATSVFAWRAPARRPSSSSQASAATALNAEIYLDDANVYDSLAEAYAAKGDRNAALANYRKSLKTDPTNTNAAAWIAKLEKEGQ